MRIFGLNLDFDAITRAVGVQPTEIRRRGDHGIAREPYPQDIWLLSSPLPRFETLESHILWLRAQLRSGKEELLALKRTCQVRSFCGVITKGSNCRFSLSPKALKLFTELGVEMETSLIFLGYSDEKALNSSFVDINEQEPTGESERYRTSVHVSLEISSQSVGSANVLRQLRTEFAESKSLLELVGNETLSLSVPVGQHSDLDTHFRWLEEFLRPHADLIRSLNRDRNVTIHCRFGTESDTGGFGISAEALRVPVELGIGIDFDIRLM